MKPTINAPTPLVSPYVGADLFDCSKLTPSPLEHHMRAVRLAPRWLLLQPCTKSTLVGQPFWTLVCEAYLPGKPGYQSVIPHDSSPCYDMGSFEPVVRNHYNYVVLMEGDPAWYPDIFNSLNMTPEMVITWMDKQGVPRAVVPDQD